MTCPQEPIPVGWKVWRGAVPDPLTQLAIDVRDHVRGYPFGAIAKTVQYQGQTVAVFVSHHTWTYRNGVLVQGICIPGCSLIVQLPIGSYGAFQDSLDQPDPTAAVYGGEPPETVDWPVVLECAGALALLIVGFAAALHFAGRR